MVSRRAILSRSRDDLTLEDSESSRIAVSEAEEDVWYMKEKLYKDHISEVLEKWGSVDDEIWAKVIVLERNRRIAKAYARAPVLTINGSEDGFDGFRIGVNGFENPMRDPKTEEFKKHIGTGCKLKMDDSGNILIKRLSKSCIYVKNTMEETAVSNDILKLPNGLLEVEKPFKLFDMKKFQQNVNRELKRQFPERHKLETQCISTIALVKNEPEVLDSPIWLMLINIVALEMLRAKMPKTSAGPPRAGLNPSHTKKMVNSGSSDEDPYSLTPSGSSGSSGKGIRDRSRDDSAQRVDKDKDYYGPQNWAAKGMQQELSDDYLEEEIPPPRQKANPRSRAALLKKAEEKRRQDDPYYCGLSARIPNFSQQKVERVRPSERDRGQSRDRLKSPTRGGGPVMPGGVPGMPGGVAQLPGPGSTPFWWHSRLYPDSGIGDLSSGGSGSSSAAHAQKGRSGPISSPQFGMSHKFGMAFHTQELSSYHDGGRKQRPYRNQFASPTRPTIFRNGWE